MTKISPQAATIALITSDAYSADRYGPREWRRVAAALEDLGRFTPAQVEEIMRSKIARWAGDQAADPSKPTAADFMAFWNVMGQRERILADIFAETLGA